MLTKFWMVYKIDIRIVNNIECQRIILKAGQAISKYWVMLKNIRVSVFKVSIEIPFFLLWL